MDMNSSLPSLKQLGNDLLSTTNTQRILALISPSLCVGFYILFAKLGWWPLAIFSIMMLTFFSYGSTSHDLVHKTLGLPHWLNEIILSIIEMLSLRSGHAYRISHLHHHQHFPNIEKDAEGSPAHMTFLRALAEGPIYVLRLWVWSWKRAHQKEKNWIFFETVTAVSLLVAALILWKQIPIFLVYVGLVIGGTWIFPLFLVYTPHNSQGKDALSQTRAFRGRIIPTLLLQHTYHLEHHLYPMVPAHHWLKLAKRLDPYFEKWGVKPIKIP